MEAGTQFIGVKPGINMQERKSNVANNPTDVFTIEDIRGGYRSFVGYFTVYTNVVSHESLTIGDEYIIVSNDGDADFTNVGADENNVGKIFIATGADPTSWGDPSAVLVDLSQSKYQIGENFNSLGFNPELLVNLTDIPEKTIVGINIPYVYDPNKIFVSMPGFGNQGFNMSYTIGDYFDITIFSVYPTIVDVGNQPIEIRIYE
jgi:hypothetical protein